MSRTFSKVFLIVIALVVMLTFLIGSFYQPALQGTTRQVQVPVSQNTANAVPNEAQSPTSSQSASTSSTSGN